MHRLGYQLTSASLVVIEAQGRELHELTLLAPDSIPLVNVSLFAEHMVQT